MKNKNTPVYLGLAGIAIAIFGLAMVYKIKKSKKSSADGCDGSNPNEEKSNIIPPMPMPMPKPPMPPPMPPPAPPAPPAPSPSPAPSIPTFVNPFGMASMGLYGYPYQANCLQTDANGVSIMTGCGSEIDLGVSGSVDL